MKQTHCDTASVYILDRVKPNYPVNMDFIKHVEKSQYTSTGKQIYIIFWHSHNHELTVWRYTDEQTRDKQYNAIMQNSNIGHKQKVIADY